MRGKLVHLFLLTLPSLLLSCNKEKNSSTEASQFEISGLHDVIVDGSGKNVVTVSIRQTSGSPEPVDIDVFGLPTAAPPMVTKKKGTPPFSSEIYFFQGGPPGIYRVKVTASSAHCYREDSLVVNAPGNDFTITGEHDVLVSGTTYRDTISVVVSYVSGNREPVQLYASGLPEGLSGGAEAPGIPDDTAKVYFGRDFLKPAPQPGTYPIRICGTNSSYQKYYNATLTVR